jgi:adenylate cyclase
LGQRYAEAEADFERAIALDRNLFEARYFYGRACFAQGKLEHAANLFERAIEIKPDDYQVALLLPQIYHSLGLEADAVAAARKGVELAQNELMANPENARAAYLGAGGLASLGESARAKEWVSRALAIDPDDLLTQYNVACVYSKLGDLEPAFDLLERLLPNANHETKAWVRHDSDFDILHAHPRWGRIVGLTT